ncbi:hypothetical protein M2447_000416 [Ereboglobus sp. PH5-10]|nr:hypothetical protein [Ereboglobus sp. PH5-10]
MAEEEGFEPYSMLLIKSLRLADLLIINILRKEYSSRKGQTREAKRSVFGNLVAT